MDTLIETRHLKKYFSSPKGTLHAVDDVNISIEAGRTIGIVGESGCGKSTLGRVLLHLLDSTSGQILYRGEDITHVSGAKLSELRGKMQIIFQDPYSSVDPRMYIEQLIGEAMRTQRLSKAEINKKTLALMDTVGIPKRLIYSYPHELDGGPAPARRHRAGLGPGPRVYRLRRAGQRSGRIHSGADPESSERASAGEKLTYMFITHDLSVVRYVSDDICVMYLGQVIERCATDELFAHPLHPYTKALLSAVPEPRLTGKKHREIIHGEVTSPINPPAGCRFAPRCPYASSECSAPQPLSEHTPGHFVSCVKAATINA